MDAHNWWNSSSAPSPSPTQIVLEPGEVVFCFGHWAGGAPQYVSSGD